MEKRRSTKEGPLEKSIEEEKVQRRRFVKEGFDREEKVHWRRKVQQKRSVREEKRVSKKESC